MRESQHIYIYIYLARAKSEATGNFYSLPRQNISSCNHAKRRRQRKRSKNNNVSNQQKSNFARVAQFVCTFLCRYFARLHRETSRNFLVTGVIEKISHVFLFNFFQCRSFSPLWPLAFLIFSPPLQNFHVDLPTKNVYFVFYFSL